MTDIEKMVELQAELIPAIEEMLKSRGIEFETDTDGPDIIISLKGIE